MACPGSFGVECRLSRDNFRNGINRLAAVRATGVPARKSLAGRSSSILRSRGKVAAQPVLRRRIQISKMSRR